MRLPSREVRRARPLLGTFFEITVDRLSERKSHCAIEAAFAVIEEVQCRMSFHDPGSMLSFLNRNAGHVAVPVDDWTFDVLTIAREVHRVSRGAFDVTVAPHLQALGFLPTDPFRRVLNQESNFSEVDFLSGHRVRFRNPKMRIDLGGIAKGFAVDRAVMELRRCGVSRGLVNAGGDLHAFGDAGFPVAIRHPTDPGLALLNFSLTNAAIASSANYFANCSLSERKLGQIVNPRTGQPDSRILSATVRASSAVMADALTKVVMLSGEDSLPVLNHFCADAIFVARGGKALCSSVWNATLDFSS